MVLSSPPRTSSIDHLPSIRLPAKDPILMVSFCSPVYIHLPTSIATASSPVVVALTRFEEAMSANKCEEVGTGPDLPPETGLTPDNICQNGLINIQSIEPGTPVGYLRVPYIYGC